MTTAFDEYLAALRDLDQIRNAQHDAAEQRRTQVRRARDSLSDVDQKISEQRWWLGKLASDCGFPTPPSQSPHPVHPAPGDGSGETRNAAAEVDAADSQLREAVYLAHRPRLLPRWRADERNGLIYGIAALLSMLAQLGVLMVASGVDTFADAIGYIVVCVLLPFVGWIAGWTVIGAVSRPMLGDAHIGPDGKMPRHWRMGLLICLSTWLVTCWLGTLFLN